MFPKWSDWNIQYTTKGLIKERIKRTVKLVVLLAGIVGAYYIRTDVGGTLMRLQIMTKLYIKLGLYGLLGLMQKGVSRLPD